MRFSVGEGKVKPVLIQLSGGDLDFLKPTAVSRYRTRKGDDAFSLGQRYLFDMKRGPIPGLRMTHVPQEISDVIAWPTNTSMRFSFNHFGFAFRQHPSGVLEAFMDERPMDALRTEGVFTYANASFVVNVEIDTYCSRDE
jgi:hypothetical protein